MKKLVIILTVIAVFIGIFFLFSKDNSQSDVISKKDMNQAEVTPPPSLIDKTKTYEAILATSMGNITIQLTASATPNTVNSFVFLAKKNFYNNTIFHRVIKGFMIQGGDPKGDGTGGPGYHFNDESITGNYTRGTVAMANSGPNTNGSQFFIMHENYDLPKNYVIFGKVISGMDVVDKIANTLVVDNGMGEKSKPVTPVVVKTVQIVEK